MSVKPLEGQAEVICSKVFSCCMGVTLNPGVLITPGDCLLL